MIHEINSNLIIIVIMNHWVEYSNCQKLFFFVYHIYFIIICIRTYFWIILILFFIYYHPFYHTHIYINVSVLFIKCPHMATWFTLNFRTALLIKDQKVGGHWNRVLKNFDFQITSEICRHTMILSCFNLFLCSD